LKPKASKVGAEKVRSTDQSAVERERRVEVKMEVEAPNFISGN
jgi:hypothetical protein